MLRTKKGKRTISIGIQEKNRLKLNTGKEALSPLQRNRFASYGIRGKTRLKKDQSNGMILAKRILVKRILAKRILALWVETV